MILDLCPGCRKRPARKSSTRLCLACYMRAYRNGGVLPTTPARERGKVPTCGHPNEKHRGNGLCPACYAEAYRRKRGVKKRGPRVSDTPAYRRRVYATQMKDPTLRKKKTHDQRRWRLKTRYGITPERVEDMYTKQAGKCALCQRPRSIDKLVVDHDHRFGAVRELLCIPCNRALGYFENNNWYLAAEAYLQRHFIPN